MDWKDIQDEGKARGYWATPSEIQDRIRQREKSKGKEAFVIFGVVIAGLAFILGIVFYLI